MMTAFGKTAFHCASVSSKPWFVLLMSLLFGMQSPKFHTNAPAPIDSLIHVFVGAALWSAPSL